MTPIFLNLSTLYLNTEKMPDADANIHVSEIKEFNLHPPQSFTSKDLENKPILRALIHELFYASQGKSICLYGMDDIKTLELIKSNMYWLYAAGGLCVGENNALLFIFRNGKWDLPKGKPEGSETHEQTALREVQEECGIQHLSIRSPLSDTWHVYADEKGTFVLKQSIWFLMDCRDRGKLIPQTEEGISEVRWVTRPSMDKIRNNAFPSIRWLLEKEGY